MRMNVPFGRVKLRRAREQLHARQNLKDAEQVSRAIMPQPVYAC